MARAPRGEERPAFRDGLSPLSAAGRPAGEPTRSPAPFIIDEARLFEVDTSGRVSVEDPAAADAHARKMWRAWIAGAGVNAVTMPLGAVAFLVGKPGLAAAAGIVALVALPLPFIPVVLARVLRPKARRR